MALNFVCLTFLFFQFTLEKQASAALSAIANFRVRVKVRASFCEHGRLFVIVQYSCTVVWLARRVGSHQYSVQYDQYSVQYETIHETPKSLPSDPIGGTLRSVRSNSLQLQ